MTIDNRNLRSLCMSGGRGGGRYTCQEYPASDSSFIFGTRHLYHFILGASP